MFAGNPLIYQVKFRPAEKIADATGKIATIRYHGHNNGRICHPFAHIIYTAKGFLAKFFFYLWVINYNVMPRLGIASGRGQTSCLQTSVYFLSFHRFIRKFAHAAPLFNNLFQFHIPSVFVCMVAKKKPLRHQNTLLAYGCINNPCQYITYAFSCGHQGDKQP